MTTNAKQQEPINVLTIGDREIELFKTQDQLSLAQSLPHGISQLEAIQVKFDEPVQSIFGQYMGNTTNSSQFKPGESYCFHELRLPSRVILGFCGSSHLDKTLSKLEPCKYDVHIVFVGYKNLPNGQRFKSFQIFTKLHPVKSQPPDTPTYDEYGELIGDEYAKQETDGPLSPKLKNNYDGVEPF